MFNTPLLSALAWLTCKGHILMLLLQRGDWFGEQFKQTCWLSWVECGKNTHTDVDFVLQPLEHRCQTLVRGPYLARSVTFDQQGNTKWLLELATLNKHHNKYNNLDTTQRSQKVAEMKRSLVSQQTISHFLSVLFLAAVSIGHRKKKKKKVKSCITFSSLVRCLSGSVMSCFTKETYATKSCSAAAQRHTSSFRVGRLSV